MYNQYNRNTSSNKQFVAVLIFFLFIIVSIVALFLYDGKEKTDETSNKQINISDNDVPEVKDSKEVTIVTSNKKNSNTTSSSNKTSNKSNKTSNKISNTSNKKSNTSNNKKSNSNYVSVSYFVARIQNNKIYVGGKTLLSVEIVPSNATDKSVKYYTSDSSIARVDSNGVITGISPGVCTITIDVTDAGTAEVDIQVLGLPVQSNSTSNKSNSNSNKSNSNSNKSNSNSNKSNSNSNKSNSNSNVPSVVRVTGVVVNPSSVSLKKDGTYQLSATVLPNNASNKAVSWSSSNTGVAKVSSSGKVTAVSAGTATITATTSDGGKKASATVTVTNPKNGWVIEGGKKYYYENDVKIKDAYRNYIYLDSNGVAQDKIGKFTATLYGARAWANQDLNIRKGTSSSTAKIGTVPRGGKVIILSAPSAENGGYILVKYDNITGYVFTNYLLINLPDVIPDVVYEITNASGSIYKAADTAIKDVTGKRLYPYFDLAYNAKIGKKTYLAPLLFPTALKFQKAYNNAKAAGYNFKVYDTYRPYQVSKDISAAFGSMLTNSDFAKKVLVDRDGVKWSETYFLSTGISMHNRGVALDLALMKDGKELDAQTPMHTLDARSVIKYNNNVSKKLSELMTSAGFGTLKSEWWHFEDNAFSTSEYNSFQVQ